MIKRGNILVVKRKTSTWENKTQWANKLSMEKSRVTYTTYSTTRHRKDDDDDDNDDDDRS